jgi:cell division septal protein FtsQ
MCGSIKGPILGAKGQNFLVTWLLYYFSPFYFLFFTFQMFRRRSIKRRSSRQDFSKNRWSMQRKRSRFLKVKQLLAGKFLVFVGSVALLSASIYTVLFTPLFIIQDAEVTTQYKDINVERVRAAIIDKVNGVNTLFLNTTDLENKTYEQFPDVSSVTCGRNVFQRIVTCEAIGYELVAVIKHQGKKYYINENGVVIGFDNRKLGLPIFDLILNPVFAGIEAAENTSIADSLVEENIPELEPDSPQPEAPSVPESLTASVLSERANGSPDPEETSPEEAAPVPEASAEREDKLLTFIQPFEVPPVEPLIINEPRKVFDVAVGLKILDPEELKNILEAISELEKVLGRKVIQAQYVQVAGELSLDSKPERAKAAIEDPAAEELALEEDPEHQFTVLLDLRRNLKDQFTKLKKSKEVIDFSQTERIDLSIDGEKVFYR